MSLRDIIAAKLRETSGTPFKLVETIAEFAALKDGPAATPAAYVVVLEEAAGDNERDTGPVLQPIETDIGVILVTENLSDSTGGAASADIDDNKAWVRKQLIGFVPDPQNGEPMTLVSGKLVRTKNGVVWWLDTYGVTTFLEAEA